MPQYAKRLLIAAAMIAMMAPLTAAGRTDESVAGGREIAEAHCAKCHGIHARDEISPLREAPPFRRFRERYPIDHLAEAFAEGIVVGHGDMPAFEFQPAEIEALLAYIKSIKK